LSKYILDASALLALLNNESGSEKVTGLINDCIINAVNLSEVVAKLNDYSIPEKDIKSILSKLNLNIIPFDEKLAIKAGNLRNSTKTKGLSLGDRACIATGIFFKLPIITTDTVWAELEIKAKFVFIR
jgi:PIN domain nuclease of toxin-antitoxin system